jgi:hypothetical protein
LTDVFFGILTNIWFFFFFFCISTADSEFSKIGGSEYIGVHKGLLKHESSVLIQLRTGKIGLNSFLHRRRVPDVQSPLCSCGLAPETPCHIAVDCPLTATARDGLAVSLAPRALRSHRDFAAVLADPDRAQTIARWFLKLNRLKEFRLAVEIGRTSKERAAKRTSGKRDKRLSRASN